MRRLACPFFLGPHTPISYLIIKGFAFDGLRGAARSFVVFDKKVAFGGMQEEEVDETTGMPFFLGAHTPHFVFDHKRVCL